MRKAFRNLGIISVLLVGIIIISGCSGYDDGSKFPAPSDASEINLPAEAKSSLKSTVSGNASIKALASEKPLREVDDWYSTDLPERGWNQLDVVQGLTIWKRGDRGLGVALIPMQNVPKDMLDVDSSANTLIIIVEDEMDSWEGFMTTIGGRALLEGGNLTFVPEGLYPSRIPAGEFSYEVVGIRNGGPSTLVNETIGRFDLVNGSEVEISGEGARPGDYLIFRYDGSRYSVQITGPNGSVSGGPHTGSPHQGTSTNGHP